MAVRKIIQINEDLCDGCGSCVIGCAEGALEIIDGKAKLVSDVYCDGLGACLGECPTGALEIIERDAPDFDEEAAMEHVAQRDEAPKEPAPLACGCPGSMVRELKPGPAAHAPAGPDQPSALRNWPLQLHLVPPTAPWLKNARLLIAADCTGFSLTTLHRDYLEGKSLIIACPKLDDISPYEDKLAHIFRENDLQDITLLYMTVPCCFGLVHIVRQALKKSGRTIPLHLVKVDVSGEIVEETEVQAA